MINKKLAPKALAVAVASISAATSAADFQLEEITVTATRRAQSVTEIPYNISAISGDQLAKQGITDMSALMKSVPGVVFADMGGRANAQNNSIVLRGLNIGTQVNNSAFGNLSVPTVSTYMDDTPLFLNLKLTDIERVEVLRGPQGTLYGSGSLAGTVRYIHNRPDLEDTYGSISAGVEMPDESDDETYNVDAMINLPLTDNMALRIAATYKDEAGVIDAYNVYQLDSTGDPVLANPADVNSAAATRTVKDHDTNETYGVRSSLRWDINEDVSALFVYHHQKQESEGNAFRDFGQNKYELDYASIDKFDQEVDLFSAEVEADLGFATLTSSTSYSETEIETTRDLSFLPALLDATPFIGGELCYFYGCYPRALFIGDEPAEREDFTQEFRLVSNSDGLVDWMAGLYYNKQEAELSLIQEVRGYADWAAQPGSRDPHELANNWYAGYLGTPWTGHYSFPTGFYPFNYRATPVAGVPQYMLEREIEFEDTAIYGELTFNWTEDWQTTFGMRYFIQKYTTELTQVFPGCGIWCSNQTPPDIDGTLIIPEDSDTVDSAIFKINTSYQLSDGANIYLTWAEGFRHGGINALPVGFGGITSSDLPYEADKTTNWELGVKGRIWEDRLDYVLATFYIDWETPQIDSFVSAAFLPAVVTGEDVVSKGVEAELSGRLTENLSFGLSYNYTDARLQKAFSTFEKSTMPGVARHQATASMDYNLPLDNGMAVNFHLDSQYKGKANNDLKGGPNFAELEEFIMVNGSISLTVEDAWSATLYVNNLLDEDEAIYTVSTTRNAAAAARPRTIGLRASYQF